VPRIWLARHGLTDWNAAQRFQGQTDIPLNTLGRLQAARLGRRLAGQQLEAIVCSDLRRARETAAAVAEVTQVLSRQAPPILAEPDLREMSFGAWEGLTYAEIESSNPEHLLAWQADLLKNAPPGGESLGRLAERVQAALDRLRAPSQEGDILVVAHGGPLQVLICLALGLSPERYWQFYLSPASLSEISFYPAGAILNRLNDTGHLGGLPKEIDPAA
jgi:alpha-ribazole phosphatase